MTPWVQYVEFNWRRSLRFYENRYAALDALENLGLLRSFRAGEHEVGARLLDRDHELEISVSGLRGDILAPNGDRARVVRAIRAAVEVLKIDEIQRMVIGARLLTPLSNDYDKVRASSGLALLGNVFTSGGIKDWALLLDRESGVANAVVQYEVGIVSKAEIPSRLMGVVGRVGPAAPDHQWDERKLPAVALFVTALWDRTERLPADQAVEELADYWDEALEEGKSLVREISSGLDVTLESEVTS